MINFNSATRWVFENQLANLYTTMVCPKCDNVINIYIYIEREREKKIMDSNPTICEEKLTTSNPNRKWRFIDSIYFSINSPFLFGLLVVNFSFIYIYIYIYIYYVSSHTEDLWYNETVCLWMTIYIYIYILISLSVIFSRRPKTMGADYSCIEYMRNFI